MQRVLVISSTRKQLMPCSPARGRQLLTQGRAAVLRRFPFTIILKDRVEGDIQPMRLKIDPGSKTTGVALVSEFKKRGNTVVWAMDLTHRGLKIKMDLIKRCALRRNRRNRKTRYRECRFLHRTRPVGWLPPSIESRFFNTLTWVGRISRFAPVSALSMEIVKFDTQVLQNPEIQGLEYQRGTLFGFELREYVLMKFGHTCVYCDKQDVPLELEHVIAKAKGGSDRASNLVLSCVPCNKKKDKQDIRVFLKDNTERLDCILEQLKTSLHDVAAMNAMRYALRDRLVLTGLPIETGTGGRTKYNRTNQDYPKAHWIDAACVGESGAAVHIDKDMHVLGITAGWHGNRQMCGTDAYGFPTRHRLKQRRFFSFQTGDIVRAVVPSGKKAGVHNGRVLVRATGNFDIATLHGRIGGIHHRHCSILQRADGYNYRKAAAHSSRQ